MKAGLWVTLALGGVAALDATPVAQTMLSQPLITSTILGLVWNDMSTALQVGIVLQILAVSTQPLGARTAEDYAVGGVVGSGLALALVARQPFLLVRDASAMVGVTVGLIVALLGVPLIRWQRRSNEALARWCEDELRAGREGALAAAHRAAIALAFAVGVGFSAVCLAGSLWAAGRLVDHESLRLAKAWALARPLWLGLGLAHVLQTFVQRRLLRGALFGIALVAAWIILMVETS